MFATLSDKFSSVFRSLSGKGKISEANVREAMADVRTALLEADVHFDVVESFIRQVQEKALGQEVLQSLKPGQQMVGIVYENLVKLMAGDDPTSGAGILFVSPGPTVIMMCGLQGSGKTTTCGKLASLLKKRGKTVMLAAADLQRPAAVTQLQVLADQVNAEVSSGPAVLFYAEPGKVAEYGKAVGAAVEVAKHALDQARKAKADVLVLDTAGRLHVNDALMGELRMVNQAVQPHQIYLVIDAMTGQDAVNGAKAFNQQLELDGVILTKFDSDTRGGAALSVKAVTSKPIKFIGVGEKLDALEEFHPDRIAQRILGMGDVLSLVEKAQEQFTQEQAEALQEKMAQGRMTMDDFLGQLKTMRRMGSMKSLLGMLPGVGNQIKDLDLDESQLQRTEAIICSMTRQEREAPQMLDNARRRRIARGSGTSAADVGQLVRGFEMVQQMSRQIAGMGMIDRLKALTGLSKVDLAAMSGARGATAPQLGPRPGPPQKRFKQRKRQSR